ncbi:MAG: DUF3102 domain-containing protein [Oscillospiraceae bacterium]|nr:DUF3102 domain-containing protein [Oscillospiraceae bacterium]
MSENQIITADINSPEYTEALTLHQQIIINGTIAANALYEMCRCLKQMRDDKLYTALGYDDFGTYCEEKANIKARQAYSYIKTYEDLGKDFLQSNANLGITKLELLTHVNPLDRAEFMENTDVGEMSVSELKAEIDRLQRENGEKGEQISFLQSTVEEKEGKLSSAEGRIKNLEQELDKLDTEYSDACDTNNIATNEINNLKKELEELRNRPAEVAVAEPDPEDINKRVSEALAQNDKKHKKEVKALEAKIKEYESSAANIKDGYEKKLQALSEKLDSEKTAADDRIKVLEEQIKTAGEAEAALIKFKIYFKEVQEALKKFVGVLGRIDDEEKRNKFRSVAEKYIGMMLEELIGEDKSNDR